MTLVFPDLSGSDLVVGMIWFGHDLVVSDPMGNTAFDRSVLMALVFTLLTL